MAYVDARFFLKVSVTLFDDHHKTNRHEYMYAAVYIYDESSIGIANSIKCILPLSSCSCNARSLACVSMYIHLAGRHLCLKPQVLSCLLSSASPLLSPPLSDCS